MQAVQSQSQEHKPVIEFPKLSMLASERTLVGAHIFIAILAVSLGSLMGPFQAFRRAPATTQVLDFFREALGTPSFLGATGDPIGMPIFSYYYQALTLHGVLNALVFTTFFIVGFSYFTTQRTLQRPLKSMGMAWTSFALMTVGVLFAAYAMLTNQANVLYTFYAPMLAHWTFYFGLTLVIIGSWVAGGVIFLTYWDWRAEHKGEGVPLAVFSILANFMMWGVATIGVATEVLTMQLPMSLGLIQTTDAQVSRILFWFFGHPLVYFWLLPAYTSWYTMIPRQLNVKLFSDSMGRVAFLMIAIFSIPIGVHHLFVDPGVSEVAKAFHSLLTFVVAVPSFLTAFNIAATLESAGKIREPANNALAKTVDSILKPFKLNFIARLPWGNPIVVGQLLGMLLFIVGGITGIMNASFTLNIALHNTTWVVGHFHMTLAGAVFLTYMGILYWLLPLLRGRKLFSRKIALAQVWTWFIGMVIFGLGMGRGGIEGAIRRTDMGQQTAYMSEHWASWMNLSAIGGTILLISIILLFITVLGTLFASKGEVETEPPIAHKAPEGTSLFFERWGLWLSIIAIASIIMWGPVLIQGLDFINGFWAVGWNPQ